MHVGKPDNIQVFSAVHGDADTALNELFISINAAAKGRSYQIEHNVYPKYGLSENKFIALGVVEWLIPDELSEKRRKFWAGIDERFVEAGNKISPELRQELIDLYMGDPEALASLSRGEMPH